MTCTVLLHEPLGKKAKERDEDKRNHQRWQQITSRKDRQVGSISFTKHLQEVHEQYKYPAIGTATFSLLSDCKSKIRNIIRQGKRTMAVGTDGVHVDTLQAGPDVCDNMLSTLWAIIRRLLMFPNAPAGATTGPLYKSGPIGP